MKFLILILIAIVSFIPVAWASQIDVSIGYGNNSIEPYFEFERIIQIEYTEESELANLLKGQTQTISFTANSTNVKMDDLITNLNNNLKELSSNSLVTDVKIKYDSQMSGNKNSTVIKYKLEMSPTIINHIVTQNSAGNDLIDTNWRGIKLETPVTVQTEKYGNFDINNPKSALDIMIPKLSEKIKSSDDILEIPLINIHPKLKDSLELWHFLIDPNGTNMNPITFGKSAKDFPFVVTSYSTGECTLRTTDCVNRNIMMGFEDTEEYSIKAIEPWISGMIEVQGFTKILKTNNVETLEVSAEPFKDEVSTSFEIVLIIIVGISVTGIILIIISRKKF